MKYLLCLLLTFLVCLPAFAQSTPNAERAPFSKREIEDAVTRGIPQKRLAGFIQQYGVSFVPDATVVADLRDKGASDEVIAAARKWSVEHSFKTAQDLISKGLFDDAETSLNNALAVDDSDPRVWSQLGDLQTTSKRTDKALASYRRAHDLFPEDADISLKLANALTDTGDPDSATTLCREVMRLNPAEPVAHLCLARSAAAKKDQDTAYKEADKAYLLGSRDNALYSITPFIALNKVIAAIGGVPMLRTVRSIHQTGNEQYNSANGIVPFESDDYIFFPDRFVHSIKNAEKKIDQRAVYTSSAAFLTNGKQSRDLNADEKASYLTALSIGILPIALNFNQPSYTYKAAGTELIEGHLAALVDITNGANTTRWYIDPATGYILRTVRQVSGKQRVSEIQNWKTFEGITLPAHVVNSDDGKLVSTFDLKAFDLNPPENQSLFVKPVAAPEPAAATTPQKPSRQVLVMTTRMPGMIRWSNSQNYYRIVDDLVGYLRQNRVALTGDSGPHPFELAKPTDTTAALDSARRLGATNLLLFIIDRPFTSWIKITAQYYDVNGVLQWQDIEEAKQRGKEQAIVEQALSSMHQKLYTRISQRNLPTY